MKPSLPYGDFFAATYEPGKCQVNLGPLNRLTSAASLPFVETFDVNAGNIQSYMALSNLVASGRHQQWRGLDYQQSS